MALLSTSLSIIVCCDNVHDQAVLSTKLAPHYDQILVCQLGQLPTLLEKEPTAQVLVSWRQFCAELRAVVDLWRIQQRPLLILLKKMQEADIQRLPESYDFVLLPFDSVLELKPWLDYARRIREKQSKVDKELEQLTEQLQERKWVEKAKGLLMRFHGLDEEKAYRLLRSSAMQSSLSISQVAKNVIHLLDAN